MHSEKNKLLPYVAVDPDVTPEILAIWMHGLGADGNDLAGVVSELHLPQDLPIKFIFPHAPMRPITINNGCMMRAWYDIKRIHRRIAIRGR
jgi:phospholipase/carboxylesterase